MSSMTLEPLEGSRQRLLVIVAVAGAVAAGIAVGAAVMVSDGIAALPPHFRTGELLGWCAVALGTGGLSLGVRDEQATLVAGGIVGSAALLGASPMSCAAIGAAGAVGGLFRRPGLPALRIGAASVLGWSMPGLLAVAAGLGGPTLGEAHPIPVASLLALWAVLVVGLPLLETAVGVMVLPPAERVGPWHAILLRVEVHTVLTALAALMAITYAAIEVAAALIVLLPIAASRVGFSMHSEGRRAVTQTLGAMTKLPEWTDMVSVGHTKRVRATVERAAVELRLDSRLRQDLVRAAELHELGHLDTGADRDDRGRVARSGAAVLEQAAMRQRVTDIVDATDPDRPLAARDPDVQIGAAILTTACELDRQSTIPDTGEAARHIVADIQRSRIRRQAAARF